MSDNPAAPARKTTIRRASRHTPWDSNCFAQALAGYLMLRRRRYANTLYLGVRKQEGTLEAHAWLRSGDMIISGKHEHESYTVIARYGWHLRPSFGYHASRSS